MQRRTHWMNVMGSVAQLAKIEDGQLIATREGPATLEFNDNVTRSINGQIGVCFCLNFLKGRQKNTVACSAAMKTIIETLFPAWMPNVEEYDLYLTKATWAKLEQIARAELKNQPQDQRPEKPLPEPTPELMPRRDASRPAPSTGPTMKDEFERCEREDDMGLSD